MAVVDKHFLDAVNTRLEQLNIACQLLDDNNLMDKTPEDLQNYWRNVCHHKNDKE